MASISAVCTLKADIYSESIYDSETGHGWFDVRVFSTEQTVDNKLQMTQENFFGEEYGLQNSIRLELLGILFGLKRVPMGVTTNIYVTNVETYARFMNYSPNGIEGDGIDLLHQIHIEFGWRKCTIFMARDIFYPIMQVRQQEPSEIYQLLEEDLWAKISHEIMVFPDVQQSGELTPKSERLFTYRVSEQIDPRSDKFKERVSDVQDHPFCRFRIGREDSGYPVDSTGHLNLSLRSCGDSSTDD